MYSRIPYKSYQDIPCHDYSNACCPYYIYRSVTDLTKMDIPEPHQDEFSWCRTIGILQCFHGHFYISDINCTGGVALDKIRVSVVYLKSTKYATLVDSLVLPSPVQIFGEMRWVAGNQVIFIKILQVFTIPKAIQMKDAMDQLLDLRSS